MKASEAFLKKKSIHTGAQIGHVLISDLLDEFHKEQNKWNRLKLEQRKEKFVDELRPFIKEYGKDMMREFYEHWTEHGPLDKKMRKEKETSWKTSLRLKKWKRNGKNFNPSNNAPEVAVINTKTHVK